MNRKQRRAQKAQSKGSKSKALEKPNLQVLFTQGREDYQTKLYSQAAKSFKAVLKIFPNHAESNYYLGEIYLAENKNEKAREHFQIATHAQPDNAEYHNSMGKVLKELKKYDKAVDSFLRSLDLQSDYADSHFQIVTIKYLQPQLALDLEEVNKKYATPELTVAYKNIGKILRDRELFTEAISSFYQATILSPEDIEAYCHLALTQYANKDISNALISIRKALVLDPDDPVHTVYLSFILSGAKPKIFDSGLKELISTALTHKDASLQLFGNIWFHQLLLDPEFEDIKDSLEITAFEAFSQRLDALEDKSLYKSPFLIRGLKKLLIPHEDLERIFTFYRRYFLNTCLVSDIEDDLRLFLIALSEHCFLNEYVFEETEEEKEKIEMLLAKILQNHEVLDDLNLCQNIATISCYQSLHEWLTDDSLKDRLRCMTDNDFLEIVKIQLDEPLEEDEIKKEIKTISDINNEISQKVREQYEKNPYPRWTAIQTVNTLMGDSDFIEGGRDKNLQILLPGCGTGQQSISACVRFPKSSILAIDLSLSSLAYAIRKTKEYGFDNITYRHGDILKLESLDQRFDIIECTGVLHHMDDPMAGWRVLTDLLKPGGHMKIGLYSEMARRCVVQARELMLDNNIGASPDEIRKGRKLLREIIKKGGEEDFSRILQSPDFYAISPCRDLIFHVQEHRFTIPQIKESLKELKLEFRRFTFSNPATWHSFKAMFPNDSKGQNLDNWHQYEQKHPGSFSKMYQFWVHKPLVFNGSANL